MRIQIIGVDCATVAAKVGLARGTYDGERPILHEATPCTMNRGVSGGVADWIRSWNGPTLIALDAPLGWPAQFGGALVTHRAGAALTVPANKCFRRTTDEHVRTTVGKTPWMLGPIGSLERHTPPWSCLRTFGGT